MAEELLPEGSIIRVDFEVRLPNAATRKQIEEWIEFALGAGCMSADNPLSDADLEAWAHSANITDTGMRGWREEFDHEITERGRSYKVRYRREVR